MTKKKAKKIILAQQKQKQVVNILTEHNPRAQYRRKLATNSAPMIRTVYQNVPMFHPLPSHPQPVGTASDIHTLIRHQAEHKARLDEHERRMNTPNTVSFGNREPQSAHEVGTSLRHPLDNVPTQPLQDPTAAPRRLQPAFEAARPDFNYMNEERSDAAEGGGGTIRLTKKGQPDKRFGKR